MISIARNISLKKIILWTLGGILLMPFAAYAIMKLRWVRTPPVGINIAVVDKSGTSPDGESHSAFFWLLENQRYLKSSRAPYKTDTDYYGFFPQENESYQVKDFKNLPDAQLDLLCKNSDMAYYTDTYGIYTNEWYKDKKVEPLLLYGEMDDKDLIFLKKMKEKGKLVIAEFNVMQPPTETRIRAEFENEFSIAWSGWSGCYFASLDPQDGKIPGWLIPAYTSQHNTQWTYSDAGIVLINEDGRVEILAEGDDLDHAVPVIHTFLYGSEHLGMKSTVDYHYWFDIVSFNDSVNHAVSAYELQVNDMGKSKLDKLGVQGRFPAVIMHKATKSGDYTFYYLCGDYSGKPIPYKTSGLKGIHNFSPLLRDCNNNRGGDSFFYKLYFPMVSNIIGEYYKDKFNRGGIRVNNLDNDAKLLDGKGSVDSRLAQPSDSPIKSLSDPI